MKNLKEQFSDILETENKEEALAFIIGKLQTREVDIVELYSEILAPSLNEMKCFWKDRRICIWKEHIRTAIVRTIVETCYPFVLEKRDELNYRKHGVAVVICPPEEYHDLGARMVADFFTICGYQAIFVGSNTPFSDFHNAVDVIKPEIVAISVSNYYNLVVTKKIIQDIKDTIQTPVKFVVGGSAFINNEENFRAIGADYYAKSFQDIERISGNGVKS